VILPLLLAGALALPPATPQRVVSLAPSLTDVVLGLGEGNRLVGVSRFDDDARVASLPREGGLLDPNLEAVVRLHPDLVLASDGVVETPTLLALRRSGLRVLAVRTDTLPQVLGAVQSVSAELGVPEAGERMRQSLEGAMAAVRAQVQAEGRRPVRVAVAVGWRPLVLAGRGSYVEPLLEAAGGENIASTSLAWPTYSVEAMVAQAPEVIVDGAPEEADSEARHLMGLLRERGSRIVRLPTGDLFRPGPRALHALPELEAALRGP
jgi:iron complex transport system substrate-binding protein